MNSPIFILTESGSLVNLSVATEVYISRQRYSKSYHVYADWMLDSLDGVSIITRESEAECQAFTNLLCSALNTWKSNFRTAVYEMHGFDYIVNLGQCREVRAEQASNGTFQVSAEWVSTRKVGSILMRNLTVDMAKAYIDRLAERLGAIDAADILRGIKPDSVGPLGGTPKPQGTPSTWDVALHFAGLAGVDVGDVIVESNDSEGLSAICRCSAYAGPHELGVGKCPANSERKVA